MKNPFKLKCFDITEAVQEGINEFSNLSGYKKIELRTPMMKKQAKKHFASMAAFFTFLK